ncbi:hypothetical protein [Nostoc sp.]
MFGRKVKFTLSNNSSVSGFFRSLQAATIHLRAIARLTKQE